MIANKPPYSRAVHGYPRIVVGELSDSRRLAFPPAGQASRTGEAGDGSSVSTADMPVESRSLNTDTVYFQTSNGMTDKFRVRLLADGRTLEIKCCGPFTNEVDEEIYGGRVVVVPDQANCVKVTAARWSDGRSVEEGF